MINNSQVEKWKRRYPHGVFAIDVEGKRCYVRMPTDKEMLNYIKQAGALTEVTEKTSTPLGNSLLNKIWLGGDTSLKTDKYYNGAVLNQLVQIGELKINNMQTRNVI